VSADADERATPPTSGSAPGERVPPETLTERFAAAHERAYGYRLDADVEAVTLRVTATVDVEPPTVSRTGEPDAKRGTRAVVFPEVGSADATVYDRDALAPGDRPDGPAVLSGAESTTVVPPGWCGTVRRDGTVVLERGDRREDDESAQTDPKSRSEADPR